MKNSAISLPGCTMQKNGTRAYIEVPKESVPVMHLNMFDQDTGFVADVVPSSGNALRLRVRERAKTLLHWSDRYLESRGVYCIDISGSRLDDMGEASYGRSPVEVLLFVKSRTLRVKPPAQGDRTPLLKRKPTTT